jgi:flagellar basal-body rod protein FlgF
MSDVFAIAEASLRNNMATLDAISHNVANANTDGFKRQIHVSSAFDQHLSSAATSETASPARDWSPGVLRHSGSPMHFAIEGEGWFQLRSPQGMVLTRNGSFELDSTGRLVSPQGWPVVLDQDVSLGSETPTLSGTNELWVSGQRVAQFDLASADAQSLEAIGAGMFRAANATATASSPGVVRQGFLEGSNVNTLTEMVGLMEAMRKAEAAQHLMQAYDQTLETAITTLGEF